MIESECCPVIHSRCSWRSVWAYFGLDERLEGAQEHLADAGEPRALVPLVDGQAAGRRQVVRENLLHARGERAREELQADLVIASHREAIDVCRADRRPAPVHRHRL